MSYEKQTWSTGQVITAEKLNHSEDGIEAVEAEIPTDAYVKPSGGIPATDLASAVQTSLGKADTALQTETDPTVPSWAKALTKPTYTASEVGAIPAPSSPASGDVLKYNGSAWIADESDELNNDIKQALLNCFAHVAWTDEYGQDYYDALESALYPPAELVSISAVYTQSGTVYDFALLNSLKEDLVVTANYSDNTSEEVTDYTLSGELVSGTSTVTVSYHGCTASFNVAVSVLTYYTLTDSNFSTNYGTRLGVNTSTEPAVKVQSHIVSGMQTTQLWDVANSDTEYITFTDENDYGLTSFKVASSTSGMQSSLKAITNVPSTVRTLHTWAPQLELVDDVSNLTEFEMKNNTVMENLDGIIGLSDNDNITTLKLQSNTGLVDLSNFIIPANVSALNYMFQNCSNLEHVRIDHEYNASITSSANLMLQNCNIKRLDLYAGNIESANIIMGGYANSKAMTVRCVPNTDTWDYMKALAEADTPSNVNFQRKYCVFHSFDANPKSIVVWGDSLTVGGDGTTISDLCVKLSNQLTNEAIVHNLGVSGSSAATQASTFLSYEAGWNDINVLFFGHNSPSTTISTYASTYVPHLSRYIVLGLVVKNYSASLNNEMAEEYGSRFVDTHAYMIANGFTITGLTPTAQDETDIANGDVPHSFMCSDYVHMNPYGGQIVATAIKEKLLALGYITNDWLAGGN